MFDPSWLSELKDAPTITKEDYGSPPSHIFMSVDPGSGHATNERGGEASKMAIISVAFREEMYIKPVVMDEMCMVSIFIISFSSYSHHPPSDQTQ